MPRESTRDQSGRRGCAVRHHVRDGSGHAHEQSRSRSERPHAWPKRALCVQSVPMLVAAELLLPPLLRLWRLWRVRLWTKLTPLWIIWAIADESSVGLNRCQRQASGRRAPNRGFVEYRARRRIARTCAESRERRRRASLGCPRAKLSRAKLSRPVSSALFQLHRLSVRRSSPLPKAVPSIH